MASRLNDNGASAAALPTVDRGAAAYNDGAAPTVYMANYAGSPSLRHLDQEYCPALLFSFAYLYGWPQPDRSIGWPVERRATHYRKWCMDSGAFSAWSMGLTINLDDYIACCRAQLAVDQTLTEVFALDDIKSWRTSLRNTERMWAAGVPAMPVYHIGEPDDVLRGYARDYPKIAIGGMARIKGRVKRQFVEQCFSRIWPCAVHGLAVGSREVAMAAPWHSIDASSCDVGPRKYGQWKAFDGAISGRRKLSARGFYDLRVEVKWYLDLEKEMRHVWRREMAEIQPRLAAAGWR